MKFWFSTDYCYNKGISITAINIRKNAKPLKNGALLQRTMLGYESLQAAGLVRSSKQIGSKSSKSLLHLYFNVTISIN